jgi:membrane-bound metal-dependent hydrolase YbcI (DUF457 family)
MAQAGMHALIGAVVRKVTPRREWLMLGIILGSLFPDLDNYFVAVATIAQLDNQHLHRTFTHSVFTILAALIACYIIAQVRKQPRWLNLGVGFATGIGLHIAIDLLFWFNGVELLWPLGGWLDLWGGVKPPLWFTKFLDPVEFLFFALFFAWLANAARAQKTNSDFLGTLRIWMISMFVLLVVFTPLAYAMSKGFMTIYGVFYLISITGAFIITIRMSQTIEELG